MQMLASRRLSTHQPPNTNWNQARFQSQLHSLVRRRTRFVTLSIVIVNTFTANRSWPFQSVFSELSFIGHGVYFLNRYSNNSLIDWLIYDAWYNEHSYRSFHIKVSSPEFPVLTKVTKSVNRRNAGMRSSVGRDPSTENSCVLSLDRPSESCKL